MFVFHKNIEILVYVDDMLLTGSNNDLINTFFAHLKKEFPIKNLGTLQYFLGLEASWTRNWLFLCQ